MRILVAIDGSNDAKAAVAWLEHLPPSEVLTSTGSVVAIPTARSGDSGVAAEIRLEAREPTRGQHVGHVGRVPQPTTTAEHRRCKHAQRFAGDIDHGDV